MEKKQSWNAAEYIDNASFVAELGHPVLALLNPRRGEQILDLGCGDGALTAEIAAAGAEVHGIDASLSMVETARGRGLSAEVGSGERLAFAQKFDGVFSNAALHWMVDYNKVIAGVHRALKGGGRFVGEFGGAGNIAALLEAMAAVFAQNKDFGPFAHPWFFPSAETYRHALTAGGFNVGYIELIARPTPLAAGVQAWLKIFADSITQGLDAGQKERFYQETEAQLKPVLYQEGKGWVADYVRLRFAAVKE